MTYLGRVYLAQRLHILGNNINRKLSDPHVHLFYGLAMVRAAWGSRLDAMSEVVFHAADHQRGVVDGIYLGSRQGE